MADGRAEIKGDQHSCHEDHGGENPQWPAADVGEHDEVHIRVHIGAGEQAQKDPDKNGGKLVTSFEKLQSAWTKSSSSRIMKLKNVR